MTIIYQKKKKTMIYEMTGNIFTTQCSTLVNTVNCSGVMGAGIALECKIRYPQMYQDYKKRCEQKLLKIGCLDVHEVAKGKLINFPTKDHWRYPSKVEYLTSGLESFIESYKSLGITSVAFPLLGASNGGIPSETSVEIMKQYLAHCSDIRVEIWHYDPHTQDDLYPQLQELFNQHSDQQLCQDSGITKAHIKKIRSRLTDLEVKSLNALLRTRGIGEASLTKLVRLLNEGEHKITSQLSLFG